MTADRTRGLLTEHIASLREAFREVQARHPFEFQAVVILPEHLHCIWSLPAGDDDFSARWRQIKSTFSRRVVPGELRSASRTEGERGVWQRRFWEHALRDEAVYRRHVEYILFNPIRQGYVNRPRLALFQLQASRR